MTTTISEKLPRCPACGGPPQRCGSIYYPRYTVHCLRCGKTTKVSDSPQEADDQWKKFNRTN